MATSLNTLVQRTRRFLRDYPVFQDTLTLSLTASATTAQVSASAGYKASGGDVVEIDYEALLTKTYSGTSLTFTRSFAGSTAATHAAAAPILVNPAFFAVEIIDALNAAKDEMFPLVYLPVLDTSLTAATDTYEYTVPNMPGTYGGDSLPIQYISRIEIKESGDNAWREDRAWTVKRDATPKIQFRRVPTSGAAIRIHGYGPFPDLAASSDTVSALFPKNAEYALTLGAASRLLGSGEAGRSRYASGIVDTREAANRPGSSMSAANNLERRFEKALLRAAMPPLPPHIVSVI